MVFVFHICRLWKVYEKGCYNLDWVVMFSIYRIEVAATL